MLLYSVNFKNRQRNIAFLFLFVLPVIFCSCLKSANYYLSGGLGEFNKEQDTLITLLSTTKAPDVRFAVTSVIAKNLKLKKQSKRLIVFLTSLVEENPDDVYNDYWLLMTANEYMEMNMPQTAAYYFERIVNSQDDLIIKGQSAKLISLNSLIKITNSPKRLTEYYSKLITDFYESTNPAYAYFMLAQSYEKLGEWSLAIQTYSKFLSLNQFDIIIPGIPDSYSYARKIVDYNSSSKNWAVETLDELVQNLTGAIRSQDYKTLERYRSKVNFFAMSWKQELSEAHPQPDFDIRNFMRGSYIQISKELDPLSTPYEAYLRTHGWNQYVRTWYLYFKKVNFPADPSIHGRWEWAGIYYGEKL